MLVQAEKLRVEQKSKSQMYIGPSPSGVCVHARAVEIGEERQEVQKGTWWMPGLSEAKKDVTSCDKPR